MKYFFASDIHGDLGGARAMATAFERERADRLFLLGDLLYHGPRNPLPPAHDPKGVIELLNGMKDKITAVRGNCDAEVDQMVLSFSLMDDYVVLPLAKGKVYLTHGHLPESRLKGLSRGDVLVNGHTHIAGVTVTDSGYVCLNPGSVSLPKGGTPACYMIYDTKENVFSIRRLTDSCEVSTYFI